MEIVKVDYEEYGIQESKAKEISAMFKPMLDKMVELEERANEIFDLPMGPEAYNKARELRLEYKKTRTGTAKIHKELKDFYLQGGRFVDGLKNTQLMAAQGMEERLAEIENHEAIEKQKRIDTLQEERSAALMKYGVEVAPENLGEMDDAVWNNYLTGTRVNFENKQKEEEERQEALRKEALDREENERKMALRNERILLASPYKNFIPGFDGFAWEELSTKEIKDLIDKAKKEEEKKREEEERVRQENERLKLEAKKRAEEEEKRRNEERARLVAEEAKRKEEEERRRKEEEAKLAAEKAKREAAEKALKEREEREKREAEERERIIQAQLSADDSEKIEALIKDLEVLAQKYTFKSDKNQKKYDGVGVLISKIIKYIRE